MGAIKIILGGLLLADSAKADNMAESVWISHWSSLDVLALAILSF